ncbi:MAG: ATPase, partial [Thermoprotei archaeon]
MPFILNKPVKMYKAAIVTSKTIIDQVLTMLQELGALHIIERREKVKEYINILDNIKRTHDMINYIFARAKGRIVDVKITMGEILSYSLETITRDVENIYEKLRSLEKSLNELERHKSVLESMTKILSALPPNANIKNVCFKGKHISSTIVVGSRDNVLKFLNEAKVVAIHKSLVGEELITVIVYPTEKEDEIIARARTYNLRTIELPSEFMKFKTVNEALVHLREELKSLDEKISDIEGDIRSLIDYSLEQLVKYKIILENRYGKLVALVNSIPRKYLTIVEGWIPENKISEVKDKMINNSLPIFIDLKEPGPSDEPPTLLSNPPVIRYFEPIIKFLGMPNYREWDPTPIIAYSFALFYGIMLGDIGYAIIIILITKFLLDKLAGPIENPDYDLFKKSLIVSSAVGLIIGMFSGAFLGDVSDRLGFKTILVNIFKPLSMIFNDPLLFLEASLIIGLVHVNIAHAIALAKALKKKNKGDALIEIGLFISEIFGIPYILVKILKVNIPWITPSILQLMLYGALAGVAIIIIGSVKNLGGLGLFMWIFNITGLLGDVLSYSRLAGVGLATIYLAISFNTMASMVYSSVSTMAPQPMNVALGLILSLIVATLGHIVNTALSALGAFIHSLRLCFVEFLTKFYEGTGYPFEPLKIIIRKKYV